MVVQPSKKKGRSPKLQTLWDGPWEVTKRVTNAVYQIQKNPKGILKFVHHDRLKRFHEQNISSHQSVILLEKRRTEIGNNFIY